jgi:hypothetical protein
LAAQADDYAFVLFIGGVEFNKKFQEKIISREVENELFLCYLRFYLRKSKI